jgi:hypothetical protein
VNNSKKEELIEKEIGDSVFFQYNDEFWYGHVQEILIEGYKVKTLHGVFYISKEDVIR